MTAHAELRSATHDRWRATATAMFLGAHLASMAGCSGDDDAGDLGREVNEDAGMACTGDGTLVDGSRCRCAAQCASALCAAEEGTGFPGGLCARTCTSDAQCADDSVCARLAGATSEGLCTPRCAVAADCGAGRLCALNFCLPYCNEDSDCESGHCNGLSGYCTDGTPPVGGGLDAPCLRNEDCASDVCSGGVCTTICGLSDPRCPSGGICTTIAPGLEEGSCHVPCTGPADCTIPGTSCSLVPVPEGASACVPSTPCLGRVTDDTHGQPCGCDDDCADGAQCQTESEYPFPRGGCYRDCRTDATVCDADSVCAELEREDVFACLHRCNGPQDCAAGRICNQREGVCELRCQLDAECLSGACDEYTGLCSPQNPGLPNGSLCPRSDACRSYFCTTFATMGENYCLSYCSVRQQVCPDDGVCVGLGVGDDFGICTPRCETVADCPGGLSCEQQSVMGVDIGACVPDPPGGRAAP